MSAFNGKQRVETYQILKALKGDGGLHRGWSRHPASRMWEGHELALLAYQKAVIDVWLSKGYKDTCWEKSRALFTEEELAQFDSGSYDLPEWFGDPEFHLRHRSRLKSKAPEIYSPLFPETPDDLEYIWPGKTLEEASAEQDAHPVN